MNTNIQTTLSSILAPLTGEKSEAKGQKTAIFDPVKGDFGALVQKLKAAYEQQTEKTPNAGADKPNDAILGMQLSEKLSEWISNKPDSPKKADGVDIDAIVADISALIAAAPEQLAATENLPVTGELPAENIENLQEIKDLLVPTEKTATVGRLDMPPAVIPPEAAGTEKLPMPVPAETSGNILGPVAETAAPAVTLPETPATHSDAQPAAPAVTTENTPLQPGPTVPVTENIQPNLPKAEAPVQVRENAFARLNQPAAHPDQNTGEQPTATDGNSSASLARQVAEAILQQPSEKPVSEETPLRQITPMPDQILNSDTARPRQPISADILKEITASSNRMDEAPASADPVEPTAAAPTGPFAVKADTPMPSNADITRQIQETVTSSYRPGDKQVVIRLDPPELGRVTLRFIEKPEGITGVLQVDQTQTRHEIERALPEIIQTLQNASIQIRKIDVVQTPQQQFDNSRNDSAFSGQESGFYQHNNPQSHPGHGDRGSAAAFEQTTETAQSLQTELAGSEKSINLLI